MNVSTLYHLFLLYVEMNDRKPRRLIAVDILQETQQRNVPCACITLAIGLLLIFNTIQVPEIAFCRLISGDGIKSRTVFIS